LSLWPPWVCPTYQVSAAPAERTRGRRLLQTPLHPQSHDFDLSRRERVSAQKAPALDDSRMGEAGVCCKPKFASGVSRGVQRV